MTGSLKAVEMFMFHLQGQSDVVSNIQLIVCTLRPFEIDVESAWSIDGSLGLPKNWSHPSAGSVNFVDAQRLFPHLRKARCMFIV